MYGGPKLLLSHQCREFTPIFIHAESVNVHKLTEHVWRSQIIIIIFNISFAQISIRIWSNARNYYKLLLSDQCREFTPIFTHADWFVVHLVVTLHALIPFLERGFPEFMDLSLADLYLGVSITISFGKLIIKGHKIDSRQPFDQFGLLRTQKNCLRLLIVRKLQMGHRFRHSHCTWSSSLVILQS